MAELSIPSIENAFRIVDKNTSTPPIIEFPESNFVVVTYWWGRGNYNKNTMRPCPDERLEAIREMNEEDPDYPLNERTDLSHPRVKAYFKTNFPKKDWRDPIKFEEMIQNWTDSCRRSGCNSLAIECPEFAVGKMYQVAINAKCYFIKKALEICAPRGIVYIDGDMIVQRYPGVFDCPNIDFAARAWSYDSRSSFMFRKLAQADATTVSRIFRTNGSKLVSKFESRFGSVLAVEKRKAPELQKYTKLINSMRTTITDISKNIKTANITGIEIDNTPAKDLIQKYNWIHTSEIVNKTILDVISKIKKYQPAGSICFDPYSFETSGGTMYFGNTSMAKNLLDQWINLALEPMHAGKADDRILSLLIMKFHLLTTLNVIFLPIEYLWLTLNYENFLSKPTNYELSDIVFEHPECLTAEEAAANLGAASNREPETYNTYVIDETNCKRTYKNNSGSNNNIVRYQSVGRNALYEKSYFPNPLFGETFQAFFRYIQSLSQNAIAFVPREYGMGRFNEIVARNEQLSNEVRSNNNVVNGLVYSSSIPNILRHLRNGQSVAHVPMGSSLNELYLQYFYDEKNYELIAVNVADARSGQPEIEPEYRPIFALSNPIIFKAGNTVLYDLLSICSSLEDLTEQFNSGYMFLHRIRCAWVPPSVRANRTKKRNVRNSANTAGNKNAKSTAQANAMLDQ